jgi:hypothetical protein
MFARLRTLIPALAALLVAAPAAAANVDLFAPETLSLSGDIRLVGVDGEQSWRDGGFGKLRSGGDGEGDFHLQPELGSVNLVWQPRFGFAWSATVVGTLQGGESTEAGLSEAYVSFKPMRGANARFAARAGLMWPPVSLEHGGADWHVLDTLTPSAINSWIGEEVRPVAVEGTVTAMLGGHELSATLAVFAANDTAATLLTFRGWALHDTRTLAFNREKLPPLPEAFEYYQAPFTHPLLDVAPGFAKRPGFYAKLGWQPPLPLRVELFHYDNRADPEAANADLEWGWRTRFDNVGVVARLGPATELKAQALAGRTRMGVTETTGIWIDCRFRSAFALLSHDFGPVKLAARAEAFDTKQRGSLVGHESAERGWAGTVALSRDFGPHLRGLVEALHVSSRREQREELGLDPRQPQTQVQAALRFSW